MDDKKNGGILIFPQIGQREKEIQIIRIFNDNIFEKEGPLLTTSFHMTPLSMNLIIGKMKTSLS